MGLVGITTLCQECDGKLQQKWELVVIHPVLCTKYCRNYIRTPYILTDILFIYL